MKALTTEKERQIVMTAPRRVSKTEKILFPIIVTIIVALTLPDAAILVGCLMMGNLMKESGVVERITKTARQRTDEHHHHLPGLLCWLHHQRFYLPEHPDRRDHRPGHRCFRCGTAGGVILAKIMCVITHGKINPLIGSAGVSARSYGCRVPRKSAREYNPATTCSCTPWVPTLPVLSAHALLLVF